MPSSMLVSAERDIVVPDTSLVQVDEGVDPESPAIAGVATLPARRANVSNR